MNRTLSALATVALGVGLLTGCGDDDGGAEAGGGGYCADLKATKKEVDALKGGDFGSLEKTTDAMHRLADEAPEEIADDWDVLVGYVDDLVDLLQEAGLTDEDLAALQSGEVPDGVDLTVLQELTDELGKLDTPEFQEASDHINAHAKDECGVDLQA